MKTRKDTCVWMIHQKNNLLNGRSHVPDREIAFCYYLFALQKFQLKVTLPVARQDTNLGLGMSVLNQNCTQLAVHRIFPSCLSTFSTEELKTRFTDSKMEKVNNSFCPHKHLESKIKCSVHPHLCTVLSVPRTGRSASCISHSAWGSYGHLNHEEGCAGAFANKYLRGVNFILKQFGFKESMGLGCQTQPGLLCGLDWNLLKPGPMS